MTGPRPRRILITGMSGTGKSTLLAGLAARGHRTVDTDDDGWAGDDGRWDAARMTALLAEPASVVISGAVDNQGTFYDRFDEVILLTAPLEVMLERVAARTDNPYGSRPEQLAEIVHHTRTVEPLLRRGATRVLDGTRPRHELVDDVEALLGP